MRIFVPIFCWISSVFLFAAKPGDVVFSELMTDPDPVVGLPVVEYLELYNRSGLTLTFSGWSLWYQGKTYNFPEGKLNPGGYLVLCSTASLLKCPTEWSVLPFKLFPALLNERGSMALLDETKTCISCLEYDFSWHENAFKAKGGWSLECLDVNNLSGLSANWTSSVDPKGGTPGSGNSVASTNPDNVPSVCTNLFVPASNQLELTFSKRMQPDGLSCLQTYKLFPEMPVTEAVAGFPLAGSVLLTLSEPLKTETLYRIRLSGLRDCSGLPLKDTVLVFGLPQSPEAGDLSLNELLFNPSHGGKDYVEFVNVSDRCIDLSMVWLSTRSEAGSLQEGVRSTEKPLPAVPGSYWLLSACADSVLSAVEMAQAAHVLNLSDFPSMPDASGNILLLSNRAEILDGAVYDEDMHFPLVKNREGVALEKIHPELASMNSENWASASSASYYGTPGFRNSQYREWDEVNEEGFKLDKSWCTPNGDGLDDRIALVYTFSKPGLVNLTIYDGYGKVVRHWAKSELLGGSGCLFWDGLDDKDCLVPMGRYILNMDYFTPDGFRSQKRMVLKVLF